MGMATMVAASAKVTAKMVAPETRVAMVTTRAMAISMTAATAAPANWQATVEGTQMTTAVAAVKLVGESSGNVDDNGGASSEVGR